MSGNPIKGVIFDFGRVISQPKPPELFRQYERELGLKPGDFIRLVDEGDELALAVTGAITADELWQRVGPRLGLHTPSALAAFRQRFFADERLDPGVLALLRRLRGRYKTALLSNAPDDLPEWLERLGIAGLFDVIVVSALEGVAKPDPRIYHLTLERLGIAPREAVFVDDAARNVTAAAAVGIHAVHFTTRDEVERQLAALLDRRPLAVHISPPLPPDYAPLADLCRAVAGERWWSPVMMLAQHTSPVEMACLCDDPEDIVRVARVGGEVAGISLLLQPEPAPLHHTAELSLVVAPRFRRHGIGRALIEAVLAAGRERGVEVVRAWVCAANGGGRALLEGLAFTEEARLRGELRRPDGRLCDMLIYSRRLWA